MAATQVLEFSPGNQVFLPQPLGYQSAGQSFTVYDSGTAPVTIDRTLITGDFRISATFTPTNTALYAAGTAEVPLVVTKAATTVTWTTPVPIPYGTPLGASQLNATSTVPGTFYYDPLPGTVLSRGSHTLSVTFIPTDTASYLVSHASVTLTVN